MIICAISEALEWTRNCVCGEGSEPTGNWGSSFQSGPESGGGKFKSGESGSEQVLKRSTKKGTLWFQSMPLFY